MGRVSTCFLMLLVTLMITQFVITLISFAYLCTHITYLESEVDTIRRFAAVRDVGSRVVRMKRSGQAPSVDSNFVSQARQSENESPMSELHKMTLIPPTGAAASVPQKFVRLEADARIPVEAMANFCRTSTAHCPAGQEGQPGPVGPPGSPGYPGKTGDRGPKGEAGSPGLDGRDGIPGEPGLDGLPGRNGFDGVPGIDGKPGLNGESGRPGFNGTDGKIGPRGPQGPSGPVGAPGKRGNTGRPGQDGKPGVQLYKVRPNSTSLFDLLIPPSILESNSSIRLLHAHEGENFRMKCIASGNPRPIVQWIRVDNASIPMGAWQDSSLEGEIINITVINRKHMGDYLCIADNGIPPKANFKFQLRVDFPPLIRINKRSVYVRAKSNAILECEVEAYPDPFQYAWEKDGRLLVSSIKHRMEIVEKTGFYRSKMRLTITQVDDSDLGTYYCVVSNKIENDVKSTKGDIFVIDIGTKRPETYQQQITFGQRAPRLTVLEDLCPTEKLNCKDCLDMKCPSVDFRQIEVQPLMGNMSFSGFSPRTTDRVIEAVGRPVMKYENFTLSHVSWLQDANPRSDVDAKKVWVIKRLNSKYIFEYNSQNDLKAGVKPREIILPYAIKGNSQVIYNGSIYYNPEGRPSVFKFDLKNPTNRDELILPGFHVNSKNYLYNDYLNVNQVDLNVDENGLWVIYGLESNNTAVIKIDANERMRPQSAMNITLNHHKFGEMFIASGVLYGVQITSDAVEITFALELYRPIQLFIKTLSFTNPFKNTTMIAYFQNTQELYTLNKGNLLAYPVKYQGTNHTSIDSYFSQNYK